MQYLYAYNYQQIWDLFTPYNWPKFRITQIIDALYKSKAYEYHDISTLPQSITALLSSHYIFFSLTCEEQIKSVTSNTVKFLFKLKDNHYIEAVAIPNTRAYTLCISTQVGCALKCCFCASSLQGLIRNLEVHEIIEQIIFIKKAGFPISNIVFMGIGEPLLNYNNLIQAVNIINDSKLLNIGARKITISTAGIIEGIQILADCDKQVKLSVSLHFPDAELRSKYMPVELKYPLSELVAALKVYQQRTNRLITIEYILFRDLNDSIRDADKLILLLSGLDYKINLISFNEVEGLGFRQPDQDKVDKFYQYLTDKHIKVTIRRKMGEDIQAACGQLRLLKSKGA